MRNFRRELLPLSRRSDAVCRARHLCFAQCKRPGGSDSLSDARVLVAGQCAKGRARLFRLDLLTLAVACGYKQATAVWEDHLEQWH
jgi:hypothetical protein